MATIREEHKVSIKIKLAGLWTSLMCCFIYADFFTLFIPGHIEQLIHGHMGIGDTSPVKLLLISVMMSIPALMIFLCLVLKSAVNRVVNIIAGSLFTLIMILTLLNSIDRWMMFYLYFGSVEIIITLTIVVFAFKWTKVSP